jgi:hypothetical protein
MGMFMLNPTNNAEALGKAVSEKLGNDAYQLPGAGAWLISYDGTAKELSDALGITDGSVGTGVIVTVGSYYGRAPTDIWEWMKVRMERS